MLRVGGGLDNSLRTRYYQEVVKEWPARQAAPQTKRLPVVGVAGRMPPHSDKPKLLQTQFQHRDEESFWAEHRGREANASVLDPKQSA